MYIEPEEYFTESARKILEEGETIKTKKSPKNSSQKKEKKWTIVFDDRKLSRVIKETWKQIQKNNENAKNK